MLLSKPTQPTYLGIGTDIYT